VDELTVKATNALIMSLSRSSGRSTYSSLYRTVAYVGL